MPRVPRLVLPGEPLHLIQRGNNRGAIFFADRDYAYFRDALGHASIQYGCAIHAYVFMTNHVHLLVTPSDTRGVARMIQAVGASGPARQAAYRELVTAQLDLDVLTDIRTATHAGSVLGSEHFRDAVEAALKRQVTRHTHGGDRRSETFRGLERRDPPTNLIPDLIPREPVQAL